MGGVWVGVGAVCAGLASARFALPLSLPCSALPHPAAPHSHPQDLEEAMMEQMEMEAEEDEFDDEFDDDVGAGVVFPWLCGLPA